jgi:hypothetical protein
MISFASVVRMSALVLLAGVLSACGDDSPSGGTPGAAASCASNSDCGQNQYCKLQALTEAPGFHPSAPPGVDCNQICSGISGMCPNIPEAQCLALCNTASDACFQCIGSATDCNGITQCAVTACSGQGAAGNSGGVGGSTGGVGGSGGTSSGTAGSTAAAKNGVCVAIPNQNTGGTSAAGGSNAAGGSSPLGGSGGSGPVGNGGSTGGCDQTDPAGKSCENSDTCKMQCQCATGTVSGNVCNQNVCQSAADTCKELCNGTPVGYCYLGK